MCFINGLTSSFPKNKVSQNQIIKLGEEIFSQNTLDFNKMSKVYKNSGVETRYLVNDLEWYKKEHSWKERNYLFKSHSLSLLKKCINETLKKTKKDVHEIGGIVIVNTTGILTPTLDAELINIFNFKNTIKRLPIFGFGCSGGVIGLSRAIDMQKNIKMPVLVCNVELCSLTFRPQVETKSNIVSTALFGDGAISYLLDENGFCKVEDTCEYTWKNTLNYMGWEIENDGLGVVFDKIIPGFVKNNLSKVILKFNKNKKVGYILHAGGMKILKAYDSIFKKHSSIKYAREILAKYGNVSSVSVLLVLELMIKKKLSGEFLMIALGPGFTLALSKIRLIKNVR